MRLIGLTVALAVSLTLAPLGAEGQSVAKMPRVGIFIFTPALKEAFLQGLREAGYVEGQNIIVEQRIGEASPTPTGKQIAELLALKVDVFVTSSLVIPDIKRATSTVPIVAVDLYSDPVASGFVASYARPSGNITGLFLDLPELASKHLQLLHETLPGLIRAAVLWDDRVSREHLRALGTAARSTNVTIRSVTVRKEDDLAQALELVVRERPQALIGWSRQAIWRRRLVRCPPRQTGTRSRFRSRRPDQISRVTPSGAR